MSELKKRKYCKYKKQCCKDKFKGKKGNKKKSFRIPNKGNGELIKCHFHKLPLNLNESVFFFFT